MSTRLKKIAINNNVACNLYLSQNLEKITFTLFLEYNKKVKINLLTCHRLSVMCIYRSISQHTVDIQ